ASFRMKLQSAEGDYAYVLWTAETADNVYAMATDTFIVRDGKIAAQSFAAHASPTSIESGRRHDETVARDVEVIGGAAPGRGGTSLRGCLWRSLEHELVSWSESVCSRIRETT